MLSEGILRLWENPEVTQINKRPGRADFEVYPSAALARGRKANPLRVVLDGAWDFYAAATLEEAEGVATGRRKRVRWGRIHVPGHPELQGHGHPHYTNIQMPFPGEPPHVPEANPAGIFRRRVAIPREWEGLRVVLHFGSAESLLAVWVDGQAVGLSKGSRTPAEFDVTRLVSGRPHVVVTALVAKWSDASFIEDQDMWWMSGLPRSVFLQALPALHIADVNVSAGLDGPDGRLHVEVALGRSGQDSASVLLQLRDPKGKAIFAKPLRRSVSWAGGHLADLRGVAVFDEVVPGVQAWSAESPVLYTVEASVSGEACHVAIRCGFRTVEVRAGSLLVNGRRVMIHGVNRHSHSAARGRAVTRKEMLEDILLMKQFHFNAVRCSHYPPDPHWLDLCDEHGLYVIDEADAESHAFHNALCRDPRYAAAWLDRVMRMVQRDRNHPSVILWSLGNESGYGPNHSAAAGWVRHADPSRPLHYEGAISVGQSGLSFLHGQDVTDIICPMYTSLEDLRKADRWLEEASRSVCRQSTEGLLEGIRGIIPLAELGRPVPALRDPVHPLDRPIILCEYSHAMGNSNGSLREYYELFRSARRIQGGFIWEWCDHGIQRVGDAANPNWAYGGDFGDSPNDANFCCDGLVGPGRSIHPALWEFRHLAQPVWIGAGCTVENRQDFTGLEWMAARWELLCDGAVVREGALKLPRLAPGKKGRVAVAHGPLARGGEHLLRVTFTARTARGVFRVGDRIGSNEIPLGGRPATRTVRRLGAPVAEESGAQLIVRMGSVECRFDRSHPGAVAVGCAGEVLLHNGPRLTLWRAPVDNDGIKLWSGQEAKPLGRWRALGLDRLVERPLGFSVRRAQGVLIISTAARASGRGRWEDVTFRTSFRFDPAAGLVVRHRVEFGADDLTDIPRVGCTWDLAADCSRIAYHARGPHENYPDRKSSAHPGLYELHPLDESLPYVMPQEFGLRCDCRSLELHFRRQLVRLDFPGPLAFSALPYRAADLTAAFHGAELKRRRHAVLTLDAAHRGVGTGSCGPDTLEAYRIRRRVHEWTTVLSVLEPGMAGHQVRR